MWINILLTILPKLIEWLLAMIAKNDRLSGRDLRKMNRITFYCNQVANLSPTVGCVVGGVPPQHGEDDD